MYDCPLVSFLIFLVWSKFLITFVCLLPNQRKSCPVLPVRCTLEADDIGSEIFSQSDGTLSSVMCFQRFNKHTFLLLEITFVYFFVYFLYLKKVSSVPLHWSWGWMGDQSTSSFTVGPQSPVHIESFKETTWIKPKTKNLPTTMKKYQHPPIL